MRKLGLVLLVVFMASCKQEKTGYVDTVKLMEEYQERKDVEAAFDKKKEVFGKKRDSISQAFQLEAQAIEAKAKGMSQSKQQQEYAIFQQKAQFLGQQLQQEEQQMQSLGQAEIDSLVSKVKDKIKTYGTTNGYTYIFSGGDGGGVLYGKDLNDLTDAILKELNENYKK